MNFFRHTLRSGLAIGLLAFPYQAFDAGDDSLVVSTLPRIALVIGNSRYKEAPLKNPGNDAGAIAGQLRQLGFTVTLQQDASRQQMLDAIRSFGNSLAKTKGVGLFYFAGHGAQLAWRNYMLPVDADIDTGEDLRTKAVDVNSLLEDIVRARNPMNVIILDACRDNPFGTKATLQQKGLSQLDAPAGTLLAYATSPGNVASDGTGANGLYTGFLLKELQAREAKIEDVFKRVRLNVRRQSSGQQIPWESTSLEQDFYFIPPAGVKKFSPEELERRFEEELDLWTKIRTTKETAPLEDYLRRFPSGKFSELAQFKLDRLLAQQGEKPAQPGPNTELRMPKGKPAFAALAPPGLFAAAYAAESARAAPPGSNPYTKGTGKADWEYRVGDSYTYSRMDVFSKVEANRFTERVTEVTDDEVIYNRGRRTTDLLGNDIVDRAGNEYTPSQIFVPEYRIGKKWSTRFHVKRPDGSKGKGKKFRIQEDDIELSFKVVAKETVTIPSGTFDAWRVEGHGHYTQGGMIVRYVYWIDPDRVRRVLAMEIVSPIGGRFRRADRYELVSYSQAGRDRVKAALAQIQ